MNLRLILGAAALVGALASVQGGLTAQVPAQPPGPPQTAEEVSLVDLTGYWVSVVNQDGAFA